MPSYFSYRRFVLDREWDEYEHPRDEGGRFVDKGGMPLYLYHSSENNFDKFEKSRGVGFHFGTKKAAQERINGPRYMYKTRLKGGKVLSLKSDFNDWDGTTVIRELENMGILHAKQTKPYWDYRNSGENMSHERYDDPVNKIARQILKDAGYSAITYINGVEDPGHTSYMVLDPEQIEIIEKNYEE